MTTVREYTEALEKESEYWNEEYERCFGVLPNPPIGLGVELPHVNAVQSKIVRHYVEEMKKVIADVKSHLE